MRRILLGIQPQKNETLRRGMSVALSQNERPAPPIRRTPSMHTHTQHHNGIKNRLKTPEELNPIEDFPPPPEFLLSNEPKPQPPVSNHSSLLAEIQQGGFKLRKTIIDRDRSAPRLR